MCTYVQTSCFSHMRALTYSFSPTYVRVSNSCYCCLLHSCSEIFTRAHANPREGWSMCTKISMVILCHTCDLQSWMDQKLHLLLKASFWTNLWINHDGKQDKRLTVASPFTLMLESKFDVFPMTLQRSLSERLCVSCFSCLPSTWKLYNF